MKIGLATRMVLKWNKKSSKEKIVYRNLFQTYGLKVLSIAISFLQIRISLDFLNSSVYGLWLTIMSFTSWINILDLGFGNGMRNKLTEAIAVNDMLTARKYLSTGYILIGAIFLGVIIIISPLILFGKWQSIFNIAGNIASKIKLSLLIVFISVCLQFVLKLISSVYFAHQKVAKTDVFAFISQLAIFIILIASKHFIKGSLLSFSLIFSITPVIIYTVVNIYAFKNRFNQLKPSFNFFNKAYTKDIMHIGGQFFIIQVSSIVLYSVDNVLINYFLGPNNVTQYSIPFRYFSFSTLSFQMILPAYWSMTIQAAKEKDVTWINGAVKTLVLIWLVFTAGSFVMLVMSNTLYKVWLGSDLKIPFSLSLTLMVYTVVTNWAAIFNTITYGLGKIKIQFYASIASIILNIPVSILLLQKTSLGLLSIPIVIIAYTVIMGIITPIYMRLKLAEIKA